jgi:hypothetical protein
VRSEDRTRPLLGRSVNRVWLRSKLNLSENSHSAYVYFRVPRAHILDPHKSFVRGLDRFRWPKRFLEVFGGFWCTILWCCFSIWVLRVPIFKLSCKKGSRSVCQGHLFKNLSNFFQNLSHLPKNCRPFRPSRSTFPKFKLSRKKWSAAPPVRVTFSKI